MSICCMMCLLYRVGIHMATIYRVKYLWLQFLAFGLLFYLLIVLFFTMFVCFHKNDHWGCLTSIAYVLFCLISFTMKISCSLRRMNFPWLARRKIPKSLTSTKPLQSPSRWNLGTDWLVLAVINEGWPKTTLEICNMNSYGWYAVLSTHISSYQDIVEFLYCKHTGYLIATFPVI